MMTNIDNSVYRTWDVYYIFHQLFCPNFSFIFIVFHYHCNCLSLLSICHVIPAVLFLMSFLIRSCVFSPVFFPHYSCFYCLFVSHCVFLFRSRIIFRGNHTITKVIRTIQLAHNWHRKIGLDICSMQVFTCKHSILRGDSKKTAV